MNIDELWIGDKIWITSRQAHGFWEGKMNPIEAKVRIGHVHHIIPLSDIEEPKEEVDTMEILKDRPILKEQTPTFSSKQLDLHIEKLNPSLEFQTPQQIILHQVKKCKEFVAFAIKKRWLTVLIIHGKGTGALKEEVYHLLSDFDEVYHKIPRNNGGAVEVWFQY